MNLLSRILLTLMLCLISFFNSLFSFLSLHFDGFKPPLTLDREKWYVKEGERGFYIQKIIQKIFNDFDFRLLKIQRTFLIVNFYVFLVAVSLSIIELVTGWDLLQNIDAFKALLGLSLYFYSLIPLGVCGQLTKKWVIPFEDSNKSNEPKPEILDKCGEDFEGENKPIFPYRQSEKDYFQSKKRKRHSHSHNTFKL